MRDRPPCRLARHDRHGRDSRLAARTAGAGLAAAAMAGAGLTAAGLAAAGLLGLAVLVAAPARGGAAAAPLPATAAPRLVVVALGTAQDGGVPQAGCDCVRCAAARRDPGRRRRVASLALHLPASGRTWLVDATPDLGEQLEVVHRYRPHPAGGPDRHPVDGVLLTHAHAGHVLGLAFFGFEVINSRDLPVYASPRMAAFLRANGPFSLLVERRNILLREMAPGAAQLLAPGLTVTPLAVPHRDELSDTVGFVVRGPRRTLLYVPDTDSWTAWATPLPEVLRRERVDVAVLDGTFYAAGELPDRDVRRIGHPLMTSTVELLRGRVRGGLEVFFTHLNHSNPALDPAGPERRALAAAGFRVLEEGQELEL
ncbi:MAG TPA: MBL fold metallo-hydrolase [Thermoanaerobaculia bacterium]|nr:MBL fold metallo-hydrolase [Thermoanaerobaculia bacterium]